MIIVALNTFIRFIFQISSKNCQWWHSWYNWSIMCLPTRSSQNPSSKSDGWAQRRTYVHFNVSIKNSNIIRSISPKYVVEPKTYKQYEFELLFILQSCYCLMLLLLRLKFLRFSKIFIGNCIQYMTPPLIASILALDIVEGLQF